MKAETLIELLDREATIAEQNTKKILDLKEELRKLHDARSEEMNKHYREMSEIQEILFGVDPEYHMGCLVHDWDVRVTEWMEAARKEMAECGRPFPEVFD